MVAMAVKLIRPKTYKIDVFQGYDDSGKRRRHTETYYGSKRDAEQREADLKKAVYSGTMTEPHKLTLTAYLELWLEKAAKPKLKYRTHSEYEANIKRYITPAIGHLLLAKVTPLAIQGFYNDMVEKDGLGPRTVRAVHTVLRGGLKRAVRWRYITTNPALDVDLPNLGGIKQPLRVPTPAQAHVILKACATDRQGIVYQFALGTGARPAEYLALEWPDIDWRNGSARIHKTLLRPKGEPWRFDTPKTKGSERTIVIPPEVLELLKAHRIKQLEDRMRMGSEWNSEYNFVFSNMYGGPLFCSELSKGFRKLLADLRDNDKIPAENKPPLGMRLYDNRHGYATLMLLNGETAKVVSEQLGHSTIVLTLNTYSHVLPSMQQAAAKRMGALLFG